MADLPLRDIDALLTTDPFRGLQHVFVTVYCRCDGASDTDSEEEYEVEDEKDAVPSTGNAGDISEEDSIWFEQQVRESTPSCSARGILKVRTQVCIYKEARFLR